MSDNTLGDKYLESLPTLKPLNLWLYTSRKLNNKASQQLGTTYTNDTGVSKPGEGSVNSVFQKWLPGDTLRMAWVWTGYFMRTALTEAQRQDMLGKQ